MLDRLKRLIDRFGVADDEPTSFEDHKLAAAALLVHATRIDGAVDAVEEDKLRSLLAGHYGLDTATLEALIGAAERAEREAVDLYGFTRRIADKLPPEQRLAIIEMLWEIAYSDGVLHEFEDNLVWRVAELLHVPARERIQLRQKVEAKAKAAAQR